VQLASLQQSTPALVSIPEVKSSTKYIFGIRRLVGRHFVQLPNGLEFGGCFGVLRPLEQCAYNTMELLLAMVAPVGLCSDKGLATAEAAGHLQQHALLERPLGLLAADDVQGPGDNKRSLASPRKDHSNSSGAPGRGGTAAAADAEDVLMGKSSALASQAFSVT
jgi:hypothetical protein